MQTGYGSKLLNESMQIFIIILIGELVKEDNNADVLEITYCVSSRVNFRCLPRI